MSFLSELKTMNIRTITKFCFALFILLFCLTGRIVAQSVIAETTLPCAPGPNRNTYYGFAGSTMIATNPVTHRVYVPLQCDSLRLAEINAAGNLERTIDLNVGHGETLGITVDTQHNRVYVAVNADGDRLVVVDLNSNSIQNFRYPTEVDGFPFYASGPLAVNPVTNRVYSVTNEWPPGSISVFNANDNTWQVIQLPIQNLIDLAIDSSQNKLYVTAQGIVSLGQLVVIDLSTNAVDRRIDFPNDFQPNYAIAFNSRTNELYFPGITEGHPSILTLDLANNTLNNIRIPDGGPNATQHSAIAVNPNTGRVYTFVDTQIVPGSWDLTTLNIMTNTITNKPMEKPLFNYGWSAGFAIDAETNRLYFQDDHRTLTVDPGSSGIISPENPVVQADDATLSFNNVTSPGTVSVAPISDPATAGEVPGGFAISDLFAYEITKDATLQFNGTVTTCFNIPTVNDETEFNSLAVLHRELNEVTGQYELIDRTSSRTFSTRAICATTASFSPFYLVRKNNKVKSLFAKSKAYKSGSTAPIKVQLLNENDQNISSPGTILTIRGLRLIGGNTTSSVIDSGDANADGNFRYDSSLQGYIFNLSTKGLAAGQYVLSFYVGSDRAFLYTVKFEVK